MATLRVPPNEASSMKFHVYTQASASGLPLQTFLSENAAQTAHSQKPLQAEIVEK